MGINVTFNFYLKLKKLIFWNIVIIIEIIYRIQASLFFKIRSRKEKEQRENKNKIKLPSFRHDCPSGCRTKVSRQSHLYPPGTFRQIWSHGFSSRHSSISTSQYRPLYPVGHWHESGRTHVPPFWHGALHIAIKITQIPHYCIQLINYSLAALYSLGKCLGFASGQTKPAWSICIVIRVVLKKKNSRLLHPWLDRVTWVHPGQHT